MTEHVTMAGQERVARAPSARPAPARHRRRLWRAAALPLLLAVGMTAYFFAGRPAQPQYVTQPVTRGPIAVAVSTSGTVNPVQTVIVGTYVSGVIENIYCDFNTNVTKGQLCAKIDPAPYQTAVDQAAASLATARAQLAKDEANLANAGTTYRRDLKLLAIGGVAQATADVDKSAYQQAQAQITYDQASIKQHQASLDAANVNLGYTNIVSPVNGTVVSRNVNVGQTVAASFQTPTLFLIATDLTKMEVDTNVSESDIGTIKKGDPAAFTVEAYPDRTFHGTVIQVRQAPQTVQNVVTYDVVVSVANKDLALKPGMTATTQIITAERKDALRVPDSALRFSPTGLNGMKPEGTPANGQGRVWVLRNGKPQPVPLKIGLTNDTDAEVLQGALKTGDFVVVGMRPNGAAQTSAAARPPRPFGL
jgi:HlyD family secretion protein